MTTNQLKKLEDELMIHYKKHNQLTSSQAKVFVKKYKKYIPKHKYCNDSTEDFQYLADMIRKNTRTYPEVYHDD